MNIPLFPKFKFLGLDDRDFIHDLLEETGPSISELTFTNLFMWRHSYRFLVSMHGSTLVILACPEERHFLFPPVGKNVDRTLLHELLSFMEEKGWQALIERFPLDLIEKMDLFNDPHISLEYRRDDSDYVYYTKELIELSGRKFHKKKNHFNAFLKVYSFDFEPITSDNINDCIRFQEKWCDMRRCQESTGLANEDMAVYEALRNWQQLKVLKGGLIRIGGQVEAFSFGEPLNEDTFVVHVEKANPEIRGIYPAINKFCCEMIWSDFMYVNREQDLGVDAIREAKLSYNPCHMIEKYRVGLATKSC